MNQSLIPALRAKTRDVVRKASYPGGPIEKGEFTMAIARRSVSTALGLGETGLDGKKWKDQVKTEVNKALVRGLCRN